MATASTVPQVGTDLIGTVYMSYADGSFYRLVCYEVPDDDYGTPNARALPIYNYWAARGGAANGVAALPEDAVRVFMPRPEQVAVGSLFVASDGASYRMLAYGTGSSCTCPNEVPRYAVTQPNGHTDEKMTNILPEDARLVWAPPQATHEKDGI